MPKETDAPAPDKPAATTPEATPTPDPVKTSTLSSVLGLIKPEEGAAPPVADARRAEDEDDESIDLMASLTKALEAEEAGGKTEPEKPAEPAADPAKPAEPAAPAEPEKPAKVAVKRKDPTVKPQEIAAEVKKLIDADKPKTPEPAPATPAVAETPAPDPIESELTPEEAEELALVRYAETKDESRKGLSEKFIKFYKEQKEFLEQAEQKAREEDPDTPYDPQQDPKYTAWLSKHQPQFTRADRKKFYAEKISDEAEQRALQKARAELAPEIEGLRRKQLELEHLPQIERRVQGFTDELVSVMPEDVVKHFMENGRDLEKTKQAFPMETEHVVATMNGARQLATTFLAVKRGLVKFDPAQNGAHAFLVRFVGEQADALIKTGGDALVRNGKTFLHPSKWTADAEAKHWTFNEEDVLGRLKTAASAEAKTRIESERKRLEKLGYVRPAPTTPAAETPKGAASAEVTPPAESEIESSPRAAATQHAGAAAPKAPAAGGNPVSRVLGLNR